MSIFSGKTIGFEHLNEKLTFLIEANLGESPFDICDKLKKNNIYYEAFQNNWSVYCSKKLGVTSIDFVVSVEADYSFGGIKSLYLEFCIPIMGGVIFEEDSEHPSPLDYKEFQNIYDSYFNF